MLLSGGIEVANLTFDFTPDMRTDSPSRLSYALRSATAADTVNVLVSSNDTNRVGPILEALNKRGYECQTKGTDDGGLNILAWKRESE
jgi:hypothetical protein